MAAKPAEGLSNLKSLTAVYMKIIINDNYKYQYEKQTSENKIANELSHVANLLSVTAQNSGKEINTRFMLCK